MTENTTGMQESDVPESEDVRFINHSIDGDYEYIVASSDATDACRRRFEDMGTTVVDDDKPGFLKHWIENFWDGPYSVKDNGDGTYSYSNPYNLQVDIFS